MRLEMDLFNMKILISKLIFSHLRPSFPDMPSNIFSTVGKAALILK